MLAVLAVLAMRQCAAAMYCEEDDCYDLLGFGSTMPLFVPSERNVYAYKCRTVFFRRS